ncbi:hypothetical protein QAD02_018543 [Eretmocerus hayati]|uniref:Uncharacterized protein n=1 Tax=Eretmocerus hayati TaxID=131215 RepID=A0ACC2PIV2_9HYME|nr:hypothetical protein QAD02_018543 [Eretmocerus hayati]
MASPITPGADPWVVQPHERARYQQQFDSLKPINGVITGVQAKDFLLQSQLPPAVLGQIWALSDTDSDGKMNINEFSIACKLINLKLRGFEVPSSLPPSLIRSLQALAAMGVVSPPTVSPIPSTISPVSNVASVPRPVAAAVPVAAVTNMVQPGIPPIAMPVGAGFVPTTGPPPKPQPPSFPNSAAGSPVQPLVSSSIAPVIPPVQMVQPIPAAVSNMGMPPVAPVAPIVPLNTAPVPATAFAMGQPVQGIPTGIIPPLPATGTIVPPVMPATTGNGVAVIPPTITPPVTPIPPNGISMNGSIMHTPVSTSTPLSTTARPPSLDRVGSVDSQHSHHSVGSPAVEWAVPHQTKLKYTQLFNTWDRTRSGFLSGPQARNIMVQTQLPQAILARVW